MGLLIGEPRLRLRLLALSRQLHRVVGDHRLVSEQLRLLAERDLLLRRIVYLKKTKRLFDLWRVYHKPLAVLMGSSDGPRGHAVLDMHFPRGTLDATRTQPGPLILLLLLRLRRLGAGHRAAGLTGAAERRPRQARGARDLREVP
jgi:hypothetical protein